MNKDKIMIFRIIVFCSIVLNSMAKQTLLITCKYELKIVKNFKIDNITSYYFKYSPTRKTLDISGKVVIII